jgi:predicted  nucleic acid-binding Zn-ribbon protein
MAKTTRKQGGSTGNGAPPAETTPESLDKVRDILFGGQMRAVETRLQGVEDRLLRGQDSLRTDFTKQLSALDAMLQKEVLSLGERLTAERARRTEELKGLSAEIKEALRGLEKRHVKLEETSGMADADLREGILQHSQAVAAEIARVSDRLSSELTRSAQELRAEKLGITALAGMFGDMASRLAAEAKGTGKNASRG